MTNVIKVLRTIEKGKIKIILYPFIIYACELTIAPKLYFNPKTEVAQQPTLYRLKIT